MILKRNVSPWKTCEPLSAIYREPGNNFITLLIINLSARRAVIPYVSRIWRHGMIANVENRGYRILMTTE